MNPSAVRLPSACLVLLLATGCVATRQEVPRPGDTVTPGTVQIQIHRPGQWYGTANGFDVTDHGKIIGVLGPRGTLLWETVPGDLKMEVSPRINMGDLEPITMKLTEGYRYYFEAEFPFFYPFSDSGLTCLGSKKSEDLKHAE